MMRSWLPSAPLENLRQRAQILKTIRDFFTERHVMEVDTPLMCHTSVTDPFIQSIPVFYKTHSQIEAQRYFLQTSPEYAMKRLLAAGAGSIYQISKAFRQGEVGRFHNPEFTLMEWYRLGFDHHDLMDEIDDLLLLILNRPKANRFSYQSLFVTYLNLDPHQATLAELKQCASVHDLTVQGDIEDKDTWLNLCMSHLIEPHLGRDAPCFIYDFPVSQAALARIQPGDPPVASRFEVYIDGIELANGFHELQDAHEQRRRFEKNLTERQQLGLETVSIDEYFLSALAHGLPECSGVALGIDRLMLIATKSDHIAKVLSFDIMRA